MTTQTDDEEKQVKDKERRRKELLALFLILLHLTRDDLFRHMSAYLRGAMALTSLSDILVSTLWASHTQATVLGRQLAGRGGPDPAEADEAFAASVMAEQVPYLTGLVKDLQDGRYTESTTVAEVGSVDTAAETGAVEGLPKALAARLRLYALRLRGTILEAFVLALPPRQMIERRLGTAVEHHCGACPRLVGFYRAGEMTQFPGDFSTPCLGFCDCRLFLDGDELVPFVTI